MVVFVGLVVLMSVYTAISFSALALGLFALGAAVLTAKRLKPAHAAAIFVVIAAGIAATLWGLRNTGEFLEKYRPSATTLASGERGAEVPESVSRRIADWTIHGRGIIETPQTLFFGHSEALDRAVTTSAHNYYLDFIYNFGAVAFLPLFALICYTVVLVLRNRSAVSGDLGLLGLALVVLFLVLVDSNFKVTLRQPYPGVFTFLLWGLLLSRLSRLRR